MRIKASFPDFRHSVDLAQKVLLEFPKYGAQATLQFSRDAFRQQGWRDTRLERWAARKNNKDKRGILIGKRAGSGNGLALRKGLSVAHDSAGWTISSDRPYAKIHNEGGQIAVPVTAKMRKYFWAMHFKARTKADKARWKGMALTTKAVFNVTIPKRQFMGKSAFLERRLALHMGRALERAMRG